MVSLSNGCRSSKSGGGTDIVADRYVPELYNALASAEAKLGKKYHGGKIYISFEEGDTRAKGGWYGKAKNGGVLGGTTIGRHSMVCLHKGKFQFIPAEHEFCHHILPGNEDSDHEAMRKAGFQW